jgi:hypothetical protein
MPGYLLVNRSQQRFYGESHCSHLVDPSQSFLIVPFQEVEGIISGRMWAKGTTSVR